MLTKTGSHVQVAWSLVVKVGNRGGPSKNYAVACLCLEYLDLVELQ